MNLPQESDASIIQALRRKGYKATPQRITICRFALQSQDHPSAQRIYNNVKEIYPTISLATVYKTLQILKEFGLIQELNFPNGEKHFDSCIKPHINLVCLQCGNIKDIDDISSREIIAKATATENFTITGQRIDVYGICEKCGSEHSKRLGKKTGE
jgi:Fur family peroxide stress response transcriptional regulator